MNFITMLAYDVRAHVIGITSTATHPLAGMRFCFPSFMQVMFAMQGEMSATVVRHPRSWTSLVSRIKNDIVTLRDDADLLMPNLKVGGEWPLITKGALAMTGNTAMDEWPSLTLTELLMPACILASCYNVSKSSPCRLNLPHALNCLLPFAAVSTNFNKLCACERWGMVGSGGLHCGCRGERQQQPGLQDKQQPQPASQCPVYCWRPVTADLPNCLPWRSGVLMDLVDPSQYLTLLPEAMKPIENQFNKSAIVELYNTVDLIGISSYAGEHSFSAGQLERKDSHLQ